MNRRLLHFSLGPVQGFIADARRTRDLWTGSFLLSWLSGQAMVALHEAGRNGGNSGDVIIFPKVEGDALFNALSAHHTGKPPENEPHIGSLPNRFKADVSGIEEPGCICERAIRDSWQKLAAAVWKQFIADDVEKLGVDTKRIWDRQVDQFWDISWVTGDDPGNNSDGRWLDQRKNWRSHYPGKAGEEGGDLCRLMGRYQEISGYPRIGGRKNQDTFFDALRDRKHLHQSSGEHRGIRALNLGADERLCAIAVIKRLFPLLDNIDEIIGWRPGGDKLNIINWPSVSYVAAVPWLKNAAKNSSADHRKAYSDSADDCLKEGHKGETETELFSLPNESFFKLDGHLFFEDGIRGWAKDEFEGPGTQEQEGKRAKLLADFDTFRKHTGGRASEFYAILQMDGDRIGAMVGAHPEIIKTGLADFTGKVIEYFDPRQGNPANGVLIYAGGDDVLAILPVETAIEAACVLRKAYTTAFEAAVSKSKSSNRANAGDFTMSASIILAQYKIPLRAVLKKAHYYLDAIAKERNGRDSLAIAVMKPGGIAFDWVSCWRKNGIDPVRTLETVSTDHKNYSSSFFYNVRERYAPLFESEETGAGEREIESAFGDPEFMTAVLKAEYKKQTNKSTLAQADVENATAPLMTIGTPFVRKNNKIEKSKKFHFDSVLVARFLSIESFRHVPVNNVSGDGDDD